MQFLDEMTRLAALRITNLFVTHGRTDYSSAVKGRTFQVRARVTGFYQKSRTGVGRVTGKPAR